ncbi:MAG TPA: pyroglutamyl-peptidase I [Pseudolabrys sp.]|jgi:pyroglutamyl-peptidase
MPTILLTGFGPFPGAPFNPTGPLVERLARLRRPCLAGIKIVPHIFPTSYAAVDGDLPKLISKHRPDALLMFGLAPRAKAIRIETRARNIASLLPDAGGAARAFKIAPGAPSTRALPAPTARLLAAARAARVPVIRSHDAGRYLCNYLCWRASATALSGSPRLAAFVHVPTIRRKVRPRHRTSRLSADDLVRAGTRLVMVIAAALRR